MFYIFQTLDYNSCLSITIINYFWMAYILLNSNSHINMHNWKLTKMQIMLYMKIVFQNNLLF